MARAEPTRAEDLRVLEILQLAAEAGGRAAMDRFKINNSQLQGLRQRTDKAAARMGCRCRRKANRDGGMAPRWWAS